MAMLMYSAKVKEYPELAGIKKEEKGRRPTRRGTILNIERKPEGVAKETITDDRGREIAFKRPDGNRLSKVCPAFTEGMTVSVQPTKIKLRKKRVG